ncbi:MAG: hypothetical protein ACK4V1_01855 [Burkholderiaceae bacterium]
MNAKWTSPIVATLMLLGLAACGGGGGGAPAGTLSLSASSSAVSLTRGASTSLPVTLTPQDGFSGTVSFVLEKDDGTAAPAGLSVTPSDTTVSGATTVTLTLASTTETPTGSHALRLRASGGALAATCGSHCADFSLYVAARGDLDPTFGSGGKVSTSFVTASDLTTDSADRGHALALAPDGKIVVAGTTTAGGIFRGFGSSNQNFALARYNPDGSLDTSFGGSIFSSGGGKAVTLFADDYNDEARALALAPDGKIVAAGLTAKGTDSRFALARYNADGALDATFGSDGRVVTPIGSTNSSAYAVALAPTGKIVVAGYSYNGTNFDFALARYNADGTLDTTFGSGGKVLTPIGASDEIAYALALAPDGKLVVAGYSHSGTKFDFALARYNADGTLDPTFGSGGKVLTPIGAGHDYAFALALAPDGKIVVVGMSSNGGNADFALARYNADGSLDTTFGSGGKVVTPIGTSHDQAYAVALAPDGRIVVAGSTYNGTKYDFALARYNADGSLDTGFGSGGKVVTTIGSGDDETYALALAPDGRIVVAGKSFNGTAFDFALVRYY